MNHQTENQPVEVTKGVQGLLGIKSKSIVVVIRLLEVCIATCDIFCKSNNVLNKYINISGMYTFVLNTIVMMITIHCYHQMNLCHHTTMKHLLWTM